MREIPKGRKLAGRISPSLRPACFSRGDLQALIGGIFYFCLLILCGPCSWRSSASTCRECFLVRCEARAGASSAVTVLPLRRPGPRAGSWAQLAGPSVLGAFFWPEGLGRKFFFAMTFSGLLLRMVAADPFSLIPLT